MTTLTVWVIGLAAFGYPWIARGIRFEIEGRKTLRRIAARARRGEF